MTAIWPAGPPKVCSEMANQARTASRNGTTSLVRSSSGTSEALGGVAVGAGCPGS